MTGMSLERILIGNSSVMCHLRALIVKVAPTALPVLVQGPTGAGKELVAAAVHAQSGRRGAFVPFNVCAIGETMFEDALFGHVRGAFTGALSDSPGFLREADGGTAFLDEVSGLPTSLQAKLLRAIETGVFRPVGGRRDVRSDFRVVAATNERLESLVGRGAVRLDFAQRVGAVTVDVPALSERVDDIPLLVRHFLDGIGCADVRLAPGALDALAAHSWPGNVRELKHVVEWAAAFSDGVLPLEAVRRALEQRASLGRARALDAELLERQRLRELLQAQSWNTELVAKELGVHRATLYRRMKRLGLATPLPAMR